MARNREGKRFAKTYGHIREKSFKFFYKFFTVRPIIGISNGQFKLVIFLIGVGYTFVSLTCWSVVMDVIDYQEYTTHLRNESAIYAVYTFCRKLGQTAADYGGLTLLAKVGYDVSAATSGYVEGVSEGILTICTAIPAVTYTLIFLLYQFGYPLTKKRLEPVYEYIRLSHEEAAARAENEG